MEKLIIANHKMNITNKNQVEKYIKELSEYKKDLIILPSIIYLEKFIQNGFICGVQDISKYKSGAYTGETSVKQIKDIGAKYVLIGHLERRKYLKEKPKTLKQKINLAKKNELEVIYCVTGKNINEELKILHDLKEVIIAFEPESSIGREAKPNEVEKKIKQIKKIYQGKVLYGGGINENNIEKLNQIKQLDGFLIGKTSINPEVLKKIIEVSKS